MLKIRSFFVNALYWKNYRFVIVSIRFDFAFDFDLYNFNLTLPVSLVCHLDSSFAVAATVRTSSAKSLSVKRTVPLGTRRHTNELSDDKLFRCSKPHTHTCTHTQTLHAPRSVLSICSTYRQRRRRRPTTTAICSAVNSRKLGRTVLAV